MLQLRGQGILYSISMEVCSVATPEKPRRFIDATQLSKGFELSRTQESEPIIQT